MSVHHHLKTETEFYQAVERGEKHFEYRLNDRDFKEYDIVFLEEVVSGIKTGRKIGPLTITYVLQGGKLGLDKDYCVFNW
jgi:hypothetical protein